jgi:hypothetical protein
MGLVLAMIASPAELQADESTLEAKQISVDASRVERNTQMIPEPLAYQNQNHSAKRKRCVYLTQVLPKRE